MRRTYSRVNADCRLRLAKARSPVIACNKQTPSSAFKAGRHVTSSYQGVNDGQRCIEDEFPMFSKMDRLSRIPNGRFKSAGRKFARYRTVRVESTTPRAAFQSYRAWNNRHGSSYTPAGVTWIIEIILFYFPVHLRTRVSSIGRVKQSLVKFSINCCTYSFFYFT